ncbi:TIGR03905 family TSCPD domain-containing protein [Halodesulfovibrio aestuarii]|uniref:TIGR03905 family TSCPD domain-containing protein n=1 Tax=Halodesulfovibrio aestuarii TaxID=126333 RepID=UPI003521035A
MYSFVPTGVCAKQILFDVTDGVIHDVKFIKGCPGSLSAISKLLEGKAVQDIIPLLKGTLCGTKNTSCPDRLAEALEEIQKGNATPYEVKPASNGFNPFA